MRFGKILFYYPLSKKIISSIKRSGDGETPSNIERMSKA
jgi:hypothetical protein